MSLIRERLLRHKKPEAMPVSATQQRAEPADTAAKVEAVSTAHPLPKEWDAIGGRMMTNEWGSFVLRRKTYPSGHRHGKYELSELNGQAESLQLLFARDGGREDASKAAANAGTEYIFHERLLFMDTETTGLGLGAGNVSFMIGIGFYEGGGFTVEQMLMRDPGEEIAMLVYLQEKLRKHPILISYNGKSFDWPIVKNRYIMNRMPLHAEPEGHIDFLYPSRSLWKHTLPSCRLGKVEEERLMVHRQEDVPGSLAPALYFEYLAEKDAAVMTGVFVHNELDVLSLAGLAVHFTGVLSGRIGWRQTVGYGNEEWFRLGLWLDKVGKHEAAEATMDALTESILAEGWGAAEARLLAVTPAVSEGSNCLLPLARYYKQHGRYEQACLLWKRYITIKGDRSTASLEPYIELSMHYEHREKRTETALMYAETALDKLWQRGALQRSGKGKPPVGRGRYSGSVGAGRLGEQPMDKEAIELEKRIHRLRRKTNVHSAAELKPQHACLVSSRRTKPQAEQLTMQLGQSV